MIFCHKVGQTAIEGYERCPFPSLSRLIEINESAVNWVRPEPACKVVGLSLITNHLSEQEAIDAIHQIEDETGLPATDTFRFGAGKLVDALDKHFS
jgi:uncharacterized NAD-dependent epimerase/dehydratase family protein